MTNSTILLRDWGVTMLQRPGVVIVSGFVVLGGTERTPRTAMLQQKLHCYHAMQ